MCCVISLLFVTHLNAQRTKGRGSIGRGATPGEDTEIGDDDKSFKTDDFSHSSQSKYILCKRSMH